MVVNVVSPHVTPLLKHFVLGPIKYRLAARRAASQAELNAVMQPPPFDLAGRLPVHMNTLAVTLTYR